MSGNGYDRNVRELDVKSIRFSKYGKISHIVNNAGFTFGKPHRQLTRVYLANLVFCHVDKVAAH